MQPLTPQPSLHLPSTVLAGSLYKSHSLSHKPGVPLGSLAVRIPQQEAGSSPAGMGSGQDVRKAQCFGKRMDQHLFWNQPHLSVPQSPVAQGPCPPTQPPVHQVLGAQTRFPIPKMAGPSAGLGPLKCCSLVLGLSDSLACASPSLGSSLGSSSRCDCSRTESQWARPHLKCHFSPSGH